MRQGQIAKYFQVKTIWGDWNTRKLSHIGELCAPPDFLAGGKWARSRSARIQPPHLVCHYLHRLGMPLVTHHTIPLSCL